jgi:hypothetical protein
VKKIILVFILAGIFSSGAFAQTDSTSGAAADSGEFKSDGCTWFPDGNYFDCCVAHDRDYYAGGSGKQRWRSDKKLFFCVAAKPKFYNKIIAPVMWLGVRVGGAPWLKTSFSWGFGRRKKNCAGLSIKKKIQS